MSKRIDVKDLNVYYGDFLAVEDVTINIEAKSVTAFIGPSGCGKSTFLRTLNRMHEVLPGWGVRPGEASCHRCSIHPGAREGKRGGGGPGNVRIIEGIVLLGSLSRPELGNFKLVASAAGRHLRQGKTPKHAIY